MKRHLLKTLAAVLAIVATAAGPAWGQNSSTSSLVFTNQYATGGATADDNVVWTVTSDGTESNYDGTKGIHYGTSKAQVQYLQLSTSGIEGTITQVKVNASTANNVDATVGVTVGGNAFGGNAQSLSNTATDYTFTGSATGAIVVRVEKPSAATGALYVKNIVVTYTPASSGGGSTPAVPHTVRFAAGNDGWTVTDVDSARSATAPAVLQNVMAGDSLVVTAPATLPGKVKSVKAVKFVAVQSIVLDKQTANLAKDSTMTLSVASVLPENAADKSYTWSSDNTSIATVIATTGVVTGMAAGTANIIATANDGSGAKDTCVVTVLRSAILDGVTLLYASDYGLETWSTVVGYNPGVMYQDGDYVRLTSNNAVLFYLGYPVYVDDNAYPSSNDYQWLFVINMYGGDFYYRQGETWQEAIDANRMVNQDWSSEGGKVKLSGNMILIDNTNYEPVAPTATIDPTASYSLSMDN